MIFSQLLKFKKAAAVILLVCFLFPTITQPVLAYDSTPLGGKTDLFKYYADIYSPALEASEMNLESFVSETFKALVFGVPFYLFARSGLGSVFDAFLCGYQLVSIGENDACTRLLARIAQTPDPAPERNIFASTLTALKNSRQSRLISGFGFIEWYGQKLGIVTPAHAQGFGYNTLNAMESVRDMWTVFRNIAYSFIVIGLVIAGFMIMFRMKISPQVVVTIQSAIPKLIATLLLITFSYAIVGFMFDLAWVLTLVFGNLLDISGVMDSVIKNSVWGLFFDWGMWSRGFIASFVILGSSIGGLIAMIGTLGVAGLVVFIILGILILYVAFRLFLILLKAYVMIILYTVIGPIWILGGVIPGVKAMGSWLGAILSQIIVFPATALLLILAQRFMDIDLGNIVEIVKDSIPGGGQPPLPLMGGITSVQTRMYIALGIIFMTPNLVKTLQVMVRKPLGIESAISLGGIWGAATALPGMYLGYQQQRAESESKFATTPDAQAAAAKRARGLGAAQQGIGTIGRWLK